MNEGSNRDNPGMDVFAETVAVSEQGDQSAAPTIRDTPPSDDDRTAFRDTFIEMREDTIFEEIPGRYSPVHPKTGASVSNDDEAELA